MHWNFSTVEILWTLTFATLLVLLVVLLGRDRIRRFPWFTASIVLVALRMLTSRLLYNKMAPIASGEIFLTLADVAAVISLLVTLEMARRAFARLSRTAWLVGTLIFLAITATVMALWGPWPAWKTLTAGSMLANLGVMQLAAQKGELLNDLLIIQLGLLLFVVGRRFQAGWRSHTRQIVLGLFTMSLAQVIVRIIWQKVANGAPPRTQAEYLRITGLQEKLLNTNSIVLLVVLVGWIICLWIDEPKTGSESSAESSGNAEA
jgi:hypothetical protein